MALLDDIKVDLRVSGTKTDSEIQGLIYAAIADMRRVGIPESMLKEDAMDPLCKQAVRMYAKALYGFDNDESEKFLDAYSLTVNQIRNSPSYMFPEGDEGE